MFIGYDMFRNLAQGKHMKRKAQKEDFQKFLLDPGVLEGEVRGYSGTQAWIHVPLSSGHLQVSHIQFCS